MTKRASSESSLLGHLEIQWLNIRDYAVKKNPEYLDYESLFSQVYNSHVTFYSRLLLVFEPERKMLY